MSSFIFLEEEVVIVVSSSVYNGENDRNVQQGLADRRCGTARDAQARTQSYRQANW